MPIMVPSGNVAPTRAHSSRIATSSLSVGQGEEDEREMPGSAL
eukprot:COSAG04_NODE_18743_length_433_cov_1.236527_1_plen_42_part_10